MNEPRYLPVTGPRFAHAVRHALDIRQCASATERLPWLSSAAIELVCGQALQVSCPQIPCGPMELLAYGQDIAAADALSALGVHLRNLHPPEAAVGLHASPEYALHFADSYHPLIRTALAHGQPVLVWQAVDSLPLAWGVIDQVDPSGQAFRVALASDAGVLCEPLSRPAIQCYALEAVTVEDHAELAYVNAMNAQLRAWASVMSRPLGLHAGTAAIDAILALPAEARRQVASEYTRLLDVVLWAAGNDPLGHFTFDNLRAFWRGLSHL